MGLETGCSGDAKLKQAVVQPAGCVLLAAAREKQSECGRGKFYIIFRAIKGVYLEKRRKKRFLKVNSVLHAIKTRENKHTKRAEASAASFNAHNSLRRAG